MPEPVSLAQRSVGFDRAPSQVSMAVDDVPIFVRNLSVFVSNPANVPVFEKTDIRKHKSIGLVGAELFDDAREVVDVTSAAGAIEPEFFEVPIALCQLVEFGSIILVVCGGIVVAGL